MHNGIAVDLAFRLDDVTRAAWCIVMSEFNGLEFDYAAGQYKEPK